MCDEFFVNPTLGQFLINTLRFGDCSGGRLETRVSAIEVAKRHESPPLTNPRLVIRGVKANRFVTISNAVFKLFLAKEGDSTVGVHVRQQFSFVISWCFNGGHD